MTIMHDLNPKALKINEKACDLTAYIGQALNIESHTVQVNQDRRVRIYLAATVEVQKL